MYYTGTFDLVLSYSQLYAHGRWRFWEWRVGLLENEGLLQLGGRAAREEINLSDSFGEWGPRQFELNLRLLVNAARDIGAQPVLVTQPRLLSPAPSEVAEKRIPYGSVGLTAPALARAFSEVDAATRRVGLDKKAGFLDLAANFNERSELFTRRVHLAKPGSEAVGTAVAEYLAPMISASGTANVDGATAKVGIAPRATLP